MNIAIVGYDVEGRASYDYYASNHDNHIVIFDEAHLSEELLPPSIEAVCGAHAIAELKRRNDFDLVLRTPGLPLHKLDGVKNVSSATQEFLKHCPAPIIGVTGTKGKGTTCSLIHAMLQAAGRTSWLVGNIGKPALTQLRNISREDIVVYEMSSYQLWDVTTSPHVAVVLMMEPDHLDRHASMDDYVDAKANIRRYQRAGDICLYYPDNDDSARIATTTLIHGETDVDPAKRFGIVDDGQVYVTSNTFVMRDDPLCSVKALQIPGKHNYMNACAAISAVKAIVDITNDQIEEGLQSFHGLPHRLKYVATVNGVSYYDDSIATTPGSVVAAIDSFFEAKVLIVGGSDKGVTYDSLVQKIADSDSVRGVVCIGQTGERLAEQIKAASQYIEVYRETSASMDDIVKRAEIIAQDGDVVILSPAAASFDMFESYADRGEKFIHAVERL